MIEFFRSPVEATDGLLGSIQRNVVSLFLAKGLTIWRETSNHAETVTWAVSHPDHGFIDADEDMFRLLNPERSPYLPYLKATGLLPSIPKLTVTFPEKTTT